MWPSQKIRTLTQDLKNHLIFIRTLSIIFEHPVVNNFVFVFRRKLGWTDENTVTKTLADFWVIFQPILFGLIGTEIQVSELDPNTVGNNF